MAIQKALPSIIEGSRKAEKNWPILKQSYELAKARDLNNIASYRQDLYNDPSFCIPIFDSYELLYLRDSTLRSLAPVLQQELSPSGFPDYSEDLNIARLNAAAYTYALATQALDQAKFLYQQASEKEESLSLARSYAKEAYNNLLSLRNYFISYKDADSLVKEAQCIATVNVGWFLENAPIVQIPPYWETLLHINLLSLSNKWIHIRQASENDDYLVRVECTESILTPIYRRNSLQIVRDSIEKKVRINDSTFVIIKEEVTCKLFEHEEFCAFKVSTLVTFYEHYLNGNYTPLRQMPFNEEARFIYTWYEADGDLRALNSEQRFNVSNIPTYYSPIPELLEKEAYNKMTLTIGSFVQDCLRQFVE